MGKALRRAEIGELKWQWRDELGVWLTESEALVAFLSSSVCRWTDVRSGVSEKALSFSYKI